MTTSVGHLAVLFKHLAYSLNPIGWKFESLTEEEKTIFKSQEKLDELEGFCCYLNIETN